MEATTLKGICSELKIDPRAHARSYALRSASRKSTRTWRRRTNRVSRGSGRKDHPLRRKPARRSLSKPRELPGLGDFQMLGRLPRAMNRSKNSRVRQFL